MMKNCSVGAVLENLSAGRMGICQEATNTLGAAVVIATRYAAVRTQFASCLSTGSDLVETPIIEYELHVSSIEFQLGLFSSFCTVNKEEIPLKEK